MNRLLVEIEKLKRDVSKLKRASQSSQDSVVRVDNVSGAQIDAGKVVYISDAGADRPEVQLADNTSLSQASTTVGVMSYDVANNSSGYVVSNGYIRNIDTSSFAAGDTLYLGTSGNITNAQPAAPNAILILGICIVSDASAGVIYVNSKLLTDTSGVSSPTNPSYVTITSEAGLANERVLTAGTGMTRTDGGAGSTVTLDVGVSGLGLSVDTTNVILTSSSDVSAGGGASILASTTDGYLTLARLGVGTTPYYPIQIRSTTQPQLRIEYDASNYSNIYTTSTGWLYVMSANNMLFRKSTADTAAAFYFQANNENYINITSNYDNSDARIAGIQFRDYTSDKWGLWKGTNNNFYLYDYTKGDTIFEAAANNYVLWTPATSFHIRNAAYGVQIEYDASNYLAIKVDSGGDASLDATGDTIKILADNSIETDNFFSHTTGWSINYAGNADFREVYADELHVKAFIAEIYSALVGALIITKSRGKLSRDFVVPIVAENITAVNTTTEVFSIAGDHSAYISASDTFIVANSTGNDGTWTVQSVTYNNPNTEITVTGDITDATVDGDITFQAFLYVEDLDDPSWADTPIFEDNDYILLRIVDMSGGGLVIANVWGTVTTPGGGSDLAGGEQYWLFTPIDDGGSPWSTIYAGSIALDYGQSGDGVWEATVLDSAGAPYSQVTTWVTDPSVPANFTVHTRVGNVDGISGFGEEYGIWAGQGTTVNDSQIVMTDNTAEIRNLDLYVTASSVNKIILNSSTPYVSVGSTAPTGYLSNDGFWVGNDSGTYKFHLGDVNGESLRWDGSTLGIYADNSNYMTLTGTTLSYIAGSNTVLTITNTPTILIGRTGGTNTNIYITSSTLSMRYDTTEFFLADTSSNYVEVGIPRITRLSSNGFAVDSDYWLYFAETTASTAAQSYMRLNGAIGGSTGTKWGFVQIPANATGGTGHWNRLDLEAELVGSGRDARITLYSANDGTEYIQLLIDNTAEFSVYDGYVTITNYVSGDIKMTGGLTVGSSTDLAANGYVTFTGDLQSRKSSVSYPVFAAHWDDDDMPLAATAHNGNSFSTGSGTIARTAWIDKDTNAYAIPADAEWLLINLIMQDSGTGARCWLGPDGTRDYNLTVYNQVANVSAADTGWVKCTAGAISYDYVASGSSTLDVYIKCWGYAI